MTQILQVQGTEKRLYQLVAPLAMDPEVLRANNNFPFKTTDQFVWYIAVEEKSVVGFIPVEQRGASFIINNYYVRDDNKVVLSQLLTSVIDSLKKEKGLFAVVLTNHQTVFEKQGFVTEKIWKRYVKMRRDK